MAAKMAATASQINLIFYIKQLKSNVFCETAVILSTTLDIYVTSNYQNNARNALLISNTIRKVVLLDILRQMVQKLGFIMQWRPSWICDLQIQKTMLEINC